MTRVPGSSVTVGGLLGQRIERTWRGNLLALDWKNDFLGPFREPTREGGYVGLGKTLDGLVRLAAHTGDSQLVELRGTVIETLLAAQSPDGYLGTHRSTARTLKRWDVHEQAYVLMALLVDWEYFDDEGSLKAATRLGDYLVRELDGAADVGPRETFDGSTSHLALLGLDRALLALHRVTGTQTYLDFCIDPLELPRWDVPIVEGRFLPVEGQMYAYLTRCLAQIELYELTGDTGLLGPTRRVLEYLGDKRAMVITGTNGIEECWHSDQTGSGDLGETCATAYLIRLLSKLLCHEGDGNYGDWMERAIYNALFAAQSPDGRHLRYYAPFEGTRAYWDKDTYCCPGNFRRIIGELPELIVYRQPRGITINLYTESEVATSLDTGQTLTIRQHTDYPNSGRVRVDVVPDHPASFTVRLRRPAWCNAPSLRVNGETVPANGSEHYLSITRTWKAGDQIELELPMSWRLIRGFKKQDGKVAVMRGPTVFTLAPSRHPELKGVDVSTLVIDPDSLGDPVPDTAIRNDGLGCRLKATVPAENRSFDLCLSEFPAPDGEATYFFCTSSTGTVSDELYGLSGQTGETHHERGTARAGIGLPLRRRSAISRQLRNM